jgi:hypothetical protein
VDRPPSPPVTAAARRRWPSDPPEGSPRRDVDALRKAEKLVDQEKYWDVIQLLEGVVPRLTGS